MPSRPWLPNRTRANVAIASIALFAASSIAAAIVTGFTLAHFGEIEDTATLDSVWTVVTFTSVGAYVACGITFLFWFRRAYGNAYATGLRGAHTVGWAVGAWFVPFLNLVRPAQIAGEMWRHAGPARVGAPGLIGIWWTSYLVHHFADNIGSRLIDDADSAALGLKFLLASDLAALLGLGLAFLMVQRLTAAHEGMHLGDQAEVFA